MNRIGLVGISWRAGGAEALARFTAAQDDRAAAIERLAREAGLDEVVYLATCNRVEVVFAGDGETPLRAYRPRIFEVLAGRPAEPGEAERTFRAWAGEGAAEHLLLVTAGLDSARVGETEIAGQVRRAYDLAGEARRVGPRLDLLFEEAFKVAARIHRRTHVGDGRESLAEIALDHLRRRLRRTGGPVALVGVSDMTQRCARILAKEEVPFLAVNRTVERAQALVRGTGGEAVSLDAFRKAPAAVEAVLSATGAPGPVLDRACLERIAARAASGEAPLVIDMAVPPDIDPVDARDAGIPRVGMEEILAEAEHNRDHKLVELAGARELVDEALLGFRRKLAERLLSPWIAAVQRRYRQTAIEGVERLLRKDLRRLEPPEREAVLRWAETLARRFAHLPAKGLRGIARDVGTDAIDAFFRHAADPALTACLQDASGGRAAARHPAPAGDEDER